MKRISLVIATYNRGERLQRTLSSLVVQTLPKEMWEVVAVNNNSSDNTAEVAHHFAAEHPDIDFRMVDEPRQGLSYARNCGIEASTGEIVAIIDDDEVVSEDFLERYVDFFAQHPKAAGAGGRITPTYEAERPEWMTRYTERAIAGTLDLGNKAIPFPEGKFFGGGNMALRRTILERYGLFDVNLGRTGKRLLGGEEKELYLRIKSEGEEMWYLPEAVIWHIIAPEKLTADYFERLSYQIGISERVRTTNNSKSAYRRRLLREVVLWGGTLVLAVGMVLTLQPVKARYLITLRSNITRGLTTE